MWFYLVISVALFFLIRWFLERQTVENLKEKYVFITGCDSGFGNQLARQLDMQGLRILAGCLTQKGAEELERVTSDRLKTIIMDVTSTESVAMATEWVKEHVGNKGLWGLVNNAGVVHPAAPNEWLTKNDFVKVLDVNLVGLIDVTLHMLPLVKKAKGRVVNVASILGRLAFYGGGYCPSKYGVEAFSDCLRRELRPSGVKIAIIEPGYFRTGMTDVQGNLNKLEQIWTNVAQETKDSYGQTYFDNYYKMFKEALVTQCSTDLYLVTDCMEHALTSKHPRTRYSGGWDAQFFFIPLSYLPTVLSDLVLTWSWPKSVRAV
ncbi:PREDICTED: 17-beta-hydroxysteroid dehydrogenase type 6 [Gekko japonicus]|uniref:17-beta-hydroxysteroid dehydrogenase type 6 n=1 Tax=Gekko japonicus TaxID=146911 RepID=A0ABM1KZL7_GEKJA|nr:PREDICTED: 17-beta-hydroxysteroid dehydrogenase type 6 [Gekko japonicus]